MRPYEVAYIIHPDLDETAFKDILDRVQGWIKDAGGEVTKVDLWGKKKLAYEIRKQTEGQYVILRTEMDPSFCIELERNLRLQESVMRFMIIHPPAEVEVPAVETPDDQSEEHPAEDQSGEENDAPVIEASDDQPEEKTAEDQSSEDDNKSKEDEAEEESKE